MKSNKIIFLLILLNAFAFNVYAGGWERLVNLRGGWKFSIGDDKNWAKPNFNDKGWEIIKVPSMWEDEGFHGYNGYAWYRKHFKISSSLKDRNIVLKLGRIDDVDEVYVNGNLVGASGTFPPNYESAYYAWRDYYVPSRYLNFEGDNVVAVRVYDSQLGGGIVDGDVGFYEKENEMRLDYNLAGEWKFSDGDNETWKEKNFDDSQWQRINVPASWESQGHNDYDGFGWYRIKFVAPDFASQKKLVLVLGKIDDIDQVFINGKLVGSTGNFEGDPYPEEFNNNNEYNQFRGYFLPEGLINIGSEIVIAVRVYDGYNVGGIYEGPIGLIEQSRYVKYWKERREDYKKKHRSNIWDWIFN